MKNAIQKAINLAIDAGYNPIEDSANQQKILLDPLFWQCLGKAEGWKQWLCSCGHYYDKSGVIICPNCKKIDAKYSWLQNWHTLIDHLADGGDAETFFTNLLTK